MRPKEGFVQFGMRVPLSLQQQMRACREETGLSFVAQFRMAMRDFLEKQGIKPNSDNQTQRA